MRIVTMPKAAALNFTNPPKTAKGEELPASSAKTNRADREGKKLVATHLPTSAHTDLRILAAKLGTTQAALIEEALTDLLHKYRAKLS
jgi:hypothetical protein